MSHRIVRLERERPSNPLAGAIELADFDQRSRTEFGCLGVVRMEGEEPTGTLQLRARGPKDVTAGDIETPAGCTVWFKRALEGPIMIEYDATVISAGGANDRVSDLNPVRVLRLAERLGYRAWVAALAASVLGVCAVLLILATLPLLHVNAAAGVLLVFIWGGALFFATFLFRLLGVWCYRARA